MDAPNSNPLPGVIIPRQETSKGTRGKRESFNYGRSGGKPKGKGARRRVIAPIEVQKKDLLKAMSRCDRKGRSQLEIVGSFHVALALSKETTSRKSILKEVRRTFLPRHT